MSTWMLLVAGLVLLAVGGEVLVRGAAGAARRLGVSPLMIGLTLVGFGTSTPELVTSLQAAFRGSPGIAIGNVVGSNIANILLILGVTALIAPIAVNPRAFRRDGTALALATAVCLALILHGTLDRTLGVMLIAGLITYLLVTYLQERSAPDIEGERIDQTVEARSTRASLWPAIFLTLAGIALTVAGARLLVDGAIDLAKGYGVSETIIGLTVVAVGTSLPELVTSLVAALRRQSDIALGNIVGSCLYNILGILGITALVRPISVPAQIANVDIWVMVAATLALLVFARSGLKLSRHEGLNLLLAYVAYMLVLYVAATGIDWP